MGRSNRLESFGSSAGARFTVMRRAGNSKCAWLSAARTRSRASRTSVSGKPTIWNDGSPGPRCTSTLTSGASIPASARLATVATVMRDKRGAPRARLLRLASLELGYARFELGELRLRALKQLLLHLEVLPQHEIEPLEPARKQSAQIFLDVLCGRVTERFVDSAAQLFENFRIDHPAKVSHQRRARSS